MDRRTGEAPEHVRPAALRGLEVLDADPDRFDRIVRLAQRLLDVPTVLVHLVDDEAATADTGIDLTDAARLRSLCAYAVVDDADVVVPDARLDERFAANPLTQGSPEVRFYVGIPVRVRGVAIGTLCAVDPRPRELGAGDLELLHDLAAMVELELHGRHEGLVDHLTGLLNRRGLERTASVLISQAARDGREVAVVFGDLDGLKAINDVHGHAAGDAALTTVAELLAETFRGSDVIARLSGDEFVVLLISQLEQFEPHDLVGAMDRFRRSLHEHNAGGDGGPRAVRLGMSLGAAAEPATDQLRLDDLLQAADEQMYRVKQARG